VQRVVENAEGGGEGEVSEEVVVQVMRVVEMQLPWSINRGHIVDLIGLLDCRLLIADRRQSVPLWRCVENTG
jgi:hypothetical protein